MKHTPFNPVSPYATCKTYILFILLKIIVKHMDMFTCNGILFNHESDYEEEKTFVTMKSSKWCKKYSKWNIRNIYN